MKHIKDIKIKELYEKMFRKKINKIKEVK